jgi:hypothetical protein
MARDDLFIRRTADFFGADDCCRLTLGRQWEPDQPLAAWLLCNPSDADAEEDDQTSRRMTHFSRLIGCGGYIAVNLWPLRTPYPAELWRRLKAREYSTDMLEANMLAIEIAAASAAVHIVAFGPEPVRRYRSRVIDTLGMFSRDGVRNLLCLGTSPAGWPLHPLARGRFAIPNHTHPMPWGFPPIDLGDEATVESDVA